MRISNIELSNYNNGFKASLSVSAKNIKRMLPKDGIKRLDKLAKTVGTNSDLIFVELSNKSVMKPVNEWFYFGGKYIQESVKSIETKIVLRHRSFGKNNFDNVIEMQVAGNSKQKKIATYKTIYKYILDCIK
jgi:hypothetical protein